MPPVPATRHPLSTQESQFVEEYLVDLDTRSASVRAGLSPHQGGALMAQPRIQEAIAQAKRRRLTRTQIYQDDALRRWVLLANADVAELAPIHRVACRHCYGEDHDYHYTLPELREAQRAHALKALQYPDRPEFARPFDIKGGPGYDSTASPHPECPQCHGEGIPKAIIRDTRYLSEGARLLYDGFKVSPGGAIELKVRDRYRAEEMFARHANMFGDRRPIDTITDGQLDEVLTRLIEHGTIEIEELATDATETEPS